MPKRDKLSKLQKRLEELSEELEELIGLQRTRLSKRRRIRIDSLRAQRRTLRSRIKRARKASSSSGGGPISASAAADINITIGKAPRAKRQPSQPSRYIPRYYGTYEVRPITQAEALRDVARALGSAQHTGSPLRSITAERQRDVVEEKTAMAAAPQVNSALAADLFRRGQASALASVFGEDSPIGAVFSERTQSVHTDSAGDPESRARAASASAREAVAQINAWNARYRGVGVEQADTASLLSDTTADSLPDIRGALLPIDYTRAPDTRSLPEIEGEQFANMPTTMSSDRAHIEQMAAAGERHARIAGDVDTFDDLGVYGDAPHTRELVYQQMPFIDPSTL